jgi:hypothetical protein
VTDKPVNVAAIGFSLAVPLDERGGGATFQTHFAADVSDAEANAVIDRIVGFAKRQRAIAELPGIRKDLEKQEATLSRMVEDFERLEAEHPLKIADLEAKAIKANEAAAAVIQKAYSAAQASGRHVDPKTFKPKGADATALRQHEAVIEEIAKEIERLNAEREQGAGVFKVSQERYGVEIAATKAKIAEAEALASG